MEKRGARYQGAIVRDHAMLLIKHRENKTGRSYWIFPGGGIEAGETEEDCVRREMREETGLDVEVLRVLVDVPTPTDRVYDNFKTYLCRPAEGEAIAGFEPEPEASSVYSIAEVKWFDLRDESGWDSDLISDPLIYPDVARVRGILGYSSPTA